MTAQDWLTAGGATVAWLALWGFVMWRTPDPLDMGLRWVDLCLAAVVVTACEVTAIAIANGHLDAFR